MKILILGSGAREHAIAKSLRQNSSVDSHQIIVSPGNVGIAEEFSCIPCDINDGKKILSVVRELDLDLVIVGPEDPLVHGVSDFLRTQNILVFGPSQKAAQLEGSKIFSKQFLNRAHVVTSAFEVVTSVDQTLAAARHFTPPYVLKANGLCAGKGVHILKTLSELEKSAREFFEERIFGDNGTRAILEQFTPGEELSYLILTNGEQFETLPLARDHKRLLDNDEGPNTGGMGAIAPIQISEDLKSKIDVEVVEPILKQMREENLFYRGVLYIGLMLTPIGPSALEFNCRFGDPEAQVILPLLDGDMATLFSEVAEGVIRPLRQKNLSACTVVIAAPGYPGSPEKGIAIQYDSAEQSANKYFLFSGVGGTSDQLTTNGGRVACSTAIASELTEAIREAYRNMTRLTFAGMQFRRDIGKTYIE